MVSEWVVLEHIVCNIQAARTHDTLVHDALERVVILLTQGSVLLEATTRVGNPEATVSARLVEAVCRDETRRLLGALSDVHPTAVPLAMPLPTAIRRPDVIGGVLIPVRPRGDPWGGVVHVHERVGVEVRLVSGGILGRLGGRDGAPGGCKTQTVPAVPCGATRRDPLGPLILLAHPDAAEVSALPRRPPRLGWAALGEVGGSLGLVVGQVPHGPRLLVEGVSVIDPTWEMGQLVLTHIDGIDTVHLLVSTVGWDIRVDTQTWTHQLLRAGRQVVHLPADVLTISEILDGFTIHVGHRRYN